ncbi:zinc transporter ZIP3-like [Morone saxatilis]|uniref:zinc transporter ZIP3-like n=1 Tax=Morone saxatilis TaxID=34816 RepID=UPI0015E23DEB|nr:zinc transporter ZIP3-like [Morone saxatilis]
MFLSLTSAGERKPLTTWRPFFQRRGSKNEPAADSEYTAPSCPRWRRNNSHAHRPSTLRPRPRPAGGGPAWLAPAGLLVGHTSVFEACPGPADDAPKWPASLPGPVAVHETLAAVALGVSVAKASLGMKDAAKLGVTVSLMIPAGMLVGMGVESAQTLAGAVASVVLQGLAAGTFLFVTFFEILSRELDDKRDRLLKVLFLILGYASLAALVFIKW